jgi:hypothetical protein
MNNEIDLAFLSSSRRMVSNTDNEQFSVAMRTNTSIGLIQNLDETIQDIS